MDRLGGTWRDASSLQSRSFTCGHCGWPLASNVGYWATGDGRVPPYEYGWIYVCHHCNRPTYLEAVPARQVPGLAFGSPVAHLPCGIESLYEEARRCTSCGAHTAATLCCRKLLMNVAVSRGAAEGMKFAAYVDYLSSQNLVPAGSKEWVDHIREVGNMATHEVKLISEDDAKELLEFSEMLLKLSFEFPARMQSKSEDRDT